jgi:hypothetical protein
MNAAFNAPRMAPPAAAAAGATAGFFGSTLLYIGILFVLIFAGIFFYFKYYGYTIQTAANAVFKTKDTSVDVTLTEDNSAIESIKILPPSAADGQNKALPFSPDERPSGMPGAVESPSFLTKAENSIKHAFDPDHQVFNVSRNLYTYDEAEPLCKAMGAELATYEQLQEAYKHGADWCNYGWVKGQMAVYPTQESTWNKLQKGPPDYRGSCGKPGVNGGIFDNPDLRFGVNCFGARPQKKDTDELLTDTDMGMPPTAGQIEFDKQVQRFREQLNDITVLPWSRGTWAGQ